MDVRPQQGDTTLRRAAMAEQTSTENQRPPLYRIAAGSILKGARVEILGTTNDKPLDTLKPMDRLWVREVLDYRLYADQQLREATVLWRNLERVFRTPQETELNRDFTEAEAAEYERQIKLKVAEHQAKYRRDAILAKLASIATSLERAAEDVRRAADQSEHYGLPNAVSRVQHDLAWLFPNLGTDNLTTDLVAWIEMDAAVKRLCGPSEPAES